MARRVRDCDWASTPLGAIETWPHSLCDAVNLMLPVGFPMIVLWGPDLTQIYNDGYRALMGNKHPEGLGQPTRECLPEVWDINAPIYGRVGAGETLTFEDRLYPITRSGKLEDAWFTLTYSPLRDDADTIAGVLVTVFETTDELRHQVELTDSEARYRAFVNASADVVYRMSPDWSQMRELDGHGFIADTTEPSEDWRDIYLLPEDRAEIQQAIDRAIATHTMFALEHRVIRADGSPGWTASRAVPMFGADGEIIEWLGTASDVTVRKHAEAVLRDTENRQAFLLNLSDALRPLRDAGDIQRAAVRLLGDHLHVSRAGYYEVEADQNEFFLTARWERETIPLPDRMLITDFGEEIQAGYRAGRTMVARDTERDVASEANLAAVRTLRIRAWIGVPLVKEGRWVGALGVHSTVPRDWTSAEIRLVEDVGERTWAAVERARVEAALRDREDRLQILVAELQHRVRNILTIVRSVFNRTREMGADAEETADHFTGRLGALARTQVIVTRTATGLADLENLIRDELLSVGVGVSGNDAVTIEGPDVAMPAAIADSIGLAIHELTTNAVKYGALKVSGATLSIRWKTNIGYGGARRLLLTWREQGVPALAVQPTRRGFGSELIEEALPYRLGAETKLEFLGGGIRCTIDVPLPADETAAGAVRRGGS